MVLSKIGQQDLAIQDLTKVLSIDKDHVNAAFARAACFNTIGQFSQAIEDYNFALLKDSSLDEKSVASNSTRQQIQNREAMRNIDNGSLTSSLATDSIPLNNYNAATPTPLTKRAPPSIPHKDGGLLNSSSTHEIGGRIDTSSSLASSVDSPFTLGGARRPPPPTPTQHMQTPATPRSSQSSQPLSQFFVANSADEHHSKGYQLRRSGDFAGAIAEYTRAINLDSNHFKAHFNRGFAFDKQGQFERAVVDYSRAIEIDPQSAFAYYNRGISLDRMGKLEPALKDFSKAIELQPSTADFYHNRAFCFRKMGRLQEAVADYSQSLRIVPSHFKALFNRSCCLEQLGALDQALSDCSQALQIQPNHSGCLTHRALLLERTNQPAEALSDLNSALVNGAEPLVIYSARPRILTKLGRFREAVHDLNSALSLSPASSVDTQLMFQRAMCFKATEEFERAIQDFSSVIQVEPNHALAYNHRGFCLRKLDRHEEALNDFTESIRLDPQNVRAYNNRAFVNAKLERFQAAVDDYSVVISLNPDNSHAYHNRGISLDKMGQFDQAIADFTRVLELDNAHDNSPATINKSSSPTATLPSAMNSQLTLTSRDKPPSPLGGFQQRQQLLRSNVLEPQVVISPQSRATDASPVRRPLALNVTPGNFHAPKSVSAKPSIALAEETARRTQALSKSFGGWQVGNASGVPSGSEPLRPVHSAPEQTVDDIQLRLSRASSLLKDFAPSSNGGGGFKGSSSSAVLSKLAERRSKTPVSNHFNSQREVNGAPIMAPFQQQPPQPAVIGWQHERKMPNTGEHTPVPSLKGHSSGVTVGRIAVPGQSSQSRPRPNEEAELRAAQTAPINAAQFLSSLKHGTLSPQTVSRKQLSPQQEQHSSPVHLQSAFNSVVSAPRGRFSQPSFETAR